MSNEAPMGRALPTSPMRATVKHSDKAPVSWVEAERQVDELLHRWAAWNEARLSMRTEPSTAEVAGFGQSIFGRLVAGMPGTGCPVCSGSAKRGTVRVVTGNSIERRVCPYCKGRGKARLRPTRSTQVNPAFIRATGPSGPQWPIDPQIEAVHRAVLDLDETRQDVIREHYFHAPWKNTTAHAKALKMRRVTYEAHLHAARRLIARSLGLCSGT